jgi:hypothetical protein
MDATVPYRQDSKLSVLPADGLNAQNVMPAGVITGFGKSGRPMFDDNLTLDSADRAHGGGHNAGRGGRS